MPVMSARRTVRGRLLTRPDAGLRFARRWEVDGCPSAPRNLGTVRNVDQIRMPFSTPAPLDDARAAQAGDLAVPPPTTSVLGVPLALTDYERTMDWMDATVADRRPGYICVAATHTVVACQEDPELAAAVHGAALVVPDGQPLVWAMNALGHDLPEPRLRPGPDGQATASAAR